MTDLYRALGIRKNASPATVRKAYRKLAMQNHPDRNPGDDAAAQRLAAVQQAYDVLSDPDRRAKYDATGDTTPPESESQRLATLMHVLVPRMEAVLNALAEAGRKIEEEDVVDHMREAVKQTLAKYEKARKQTVTMKAALEASAERFGVDDGENLLKRAAQAQAAELAGRLNAIEREIAGHKAAADYLKRCKFTHVARAAKMGGGWVVASASASAW